MGLQTVVGVVASANEDLSCDLGKPSTVQPACAT